MKIKQEDSPMILTVASLIFCWSRSVAEMALARSILSCLASSAEAHSRAAKALTASSRSFVSSSSFKLFSFWTSSSPSACSRRIISNCALAASEWIQPSRVLAKPSAQENNNSEASR